MPQLDPATYPSQVFWLLVCFALLCLVMVSILVPRIAKTLEARERRLREDLEQANKLREEVETLHGLSLTELSNSRRDASKLLQQTHDDLNTLKQQRLRAFDEELSRKIKDLREHLDVEKNNVLSNLSGVVTHLIEIVSPQILAQPIQEATIKNVVDRVIEERRLG